MTLSEKFTKHKFTKFISITTKKLKTESIFNTDLIELLEEKFLGNISYFR